MAAKKSLDTVSFLEDALITVEFIDIACDEQGIVSAVPEVINIGRSTAKVYGYTINGIDRNFQTIIPANQSYRGPRTNLDVTDEKGKFPIEITLRTALKPRGIFSGSGHIMREVVGGKPHVWVRTLLMNERQKK